MTTTITEDDDEKMIVVDEEKEKKHKHKHKKEKKDNKHKKEKKEKTDKKDKKKKKKSATTNTNEALVDLRKFDFPVLFTLYGSYEKDVFNMVYGAQLSRESRLVGILGDRDRYCDIQNNICDKKEITDWQHRNICGAQVRPTQQDNTYIVTINAVPSVKIYTSLKVKHGKQEVVCQVLDASTQKFKTFKHVKVIFTKTDLMKAKIDVTFFTKKGDVVMEIKDFDVSSMVSDYMRSLI